MTSFPRTLYILPPVLLVLCAALWYLAREPQEDDPRLIASSPVRQVLDVREAPKGITGTCSGAPVEVPGTPARYLVVSLTKDGMHLGWSATPEADPDESVTVPAQAIQIIGWVDKKDSNRIEVQAPTAFTPDAAKAVIDLHLIR